MRGWVNGYSRHFFELTSSCAFDTGKARRSAGLQFIANAIRYTPTKGKQEVFGGDVEDGDAVISGVRNVQSLFAVIQSQPARTFSVTGSRSLLSDKGICHRRRCNKRTAHRYHPNYLDQ